MVCAGGADDEIRMPVAVDVADARQRLAGVVARLAAQLEAPRAELREVERAWVAAAEDDEDGAGEPIPIATEDGGAARARRPEGKVLHPVAVDVARARHRGAELAARAGRR